MSEKANPSDKIELLSMDLFDTNREEMEIVETFQKYFDVALGWHYFLDLAWIIRNIKPIPRGSMILDAGAGSGLLQFILAELGYNVISADFLGRSFSPEYIERYGKVIHCLNNQAQSFDNRYTKHLKAAYGGIRTGKMSGLREFLRRDVRAKDLLSFIEKNKFSQFKNEPEQFLEGEAEKTCGRIFLYKCDLKDMALLPDGIIDGVVSVSALEHNDHKDFHDCMEEILRVTKPSGKILATVSAAQSDDWFHMPSNGWCYSEATLKKLFRLVEGVESNFPQKDLLFQEMRKEGNPLHKRLAQVYYQSGENGMPWGKWAPEYIPVGILKVKV